MLTKRSLSFIEGLCMCASTDQSSRLNFSSATERFREHKNFQNM